MISLNKTIKRLGNRLIFVAGRAQQTGAIQQRQRLSGMLNYYYRPPA
jgi:hypothetical protein